MIPLARGWAEPDSTPAEVTRSSSGETPAAGQSATTWGRPRVRVPVLSNTTCLIRLSRSRISPPRKMIPLPAAAPVPATTAVGVASPGWIVYSLDAALTVSLPPPGVPFITGFSPATSFPGTTVAIFGTNFSSTAASNTVYIGAVQAAVLSASVTFVARSGVPLIRIRMRNNSWSLR